MQQQPARPDVPRLCRPCPVYFRQAWVAHHGLPLQPWCNAGEAPALLRAGDSPPLQQPVVYFARTGGRQALNGALQYGPFRRDTYRRCVGEPGQCVLYGQEQEALRRQLEAVGLTFVAVSWDRTSFFTRLFAAECANYLLGRHRAFPIFCSEGRGGFPWLGGRWGKGLEEVQRAVRRELRLLLRALMEEPLRQLGDAARGAGVPLLPWPLDLLAEERGLPRVPADALRVEEVQHNAVRIHRARTRSSAEEASPEELAGTLRDGGPGGALLRFPAETHMRGSCTRPLQDGGFVAPRDLRRWAHLPLVARRQWPQLESEEDPRCAPQLAAPAPAQPPHGDHLVVRPPWATWVRSLSESLGRTVRHWDALWECRALGAPPEGHCFFEGHRQLAERAGFLRSAEALRLMREAYPASAPRIRGDNREEMPAGQPLVLSTVEDLGAAFVFTPQQVRRFLERFPEFVEVRAEHDVSRRLPALRGASLCLSEAMLQRRRARGEPSPGAVHLHGCSVPDTVAASFVAESAGQGALLRGAHAQDRLAEMAAARARTRAELAAPRWDAGTPLVPGLSGARGEALGDVLFVAAHAREFEALPACAAEACLALFPADVRRPCYELQVASVRLMEREVHRLRAQRRPLLLVAVPGAATKLFAGLPELLRHAPSDAQPLPGEALEALPAAHPRLPAPYGLATWAQLHRFPCPHAAPRRHPGVQEAWAALRARFLERPAPRPKRRRAAATPPRPKRRRAQ